MASAMETAVLIWLRDGTALLADFLQRWMRFSRVPGEQKKIVQRTFDKVNNKEIPS